jgi:hypothetical protein
MNTKVGTQRPEINSRYFERPVEVCFTRVVVILQKLCSTKYDKKREGIICLGGIMQYSSEELS